MTVPSDIQKAHEARQALRKPAKGPDYHAWVFHPETGEVHLSDDHKKPRRHKDHHKGLAKKVKHHPDRVHGYAYPIIGGFRICDHDHKPVDQFIAQRVTESISGNSNGDSAGSQDSEASAGSSDSSVSD